MASKVIVYGGKGALGSVLVTHFKQRGDWVISIDLGANDAADANVVIDSSGDLNAQAAQVGLESIVSCSENVSDS